MAADRTTSPYGLLSGDLTRLLPQQPSLSQQLAQRLAGLLGPSADAQGGLLGNGAPGALPQFGGGGFDPSGLPQLPQPQPQPQQPAPSQPAPAQTGSGRGLLDYVEAPFQAVGGLFGGGQTQPPQKMATTVRPVSPVPQGSGSAPSQQQGLFQKLGNILMLPINGLNDFADQAAHAPEELAQYRQMRDLAIQKEKLGITQQQNLVNFMGNLGSWLDDGSDSTPGRPSSPGIPQLPPLAAPPAAVSMDAGPAQAPGQATRGLRNLNPGNVRALANGQTWQGQTGVDSQGYATFGNMQDGIHASLVNLHNYGQLHGINTVQGVIQRWSPGAPAAYAQSVAAGLGVSPTDRIDLNDPQTLGKVAQGIFGFENGGWPRGQDGGDQGTGQAGPAPSALPPQATGGAQPPLLPGQAGPGGLPPLPGEGSSAQVGLSPRARKGMAMMALLGGHADQAATIMSGDVSSDSNGNLIDHKSGRLLGHVPAASYVNGYRVDPNAPNAPDFVPNLPAGTMPDGRGGVISIPGFAGAARSQKYAETAGTNDANWQGDLISVPMGDGTTRTMTRAQFAGMMGGQGAAGAPGSAGAGAPGVASPSAAQTEFDKTQAGDASKTLSGDMDARSQALQDLDSARTALAYVQAHPNGTNPATPFRVAGANYLRSLSPQTLTSLGIPAGKVDQFANDAGVYQRLSAENLLTFSKSHLPSRYTEREMAVASKVIPGLSTAPDAATFHWGLQASIANKALQRADFSANYKGAPSRQGVEQQWNTTPAGQASLFEDPVWQGLKIGGKPAVVFTKDPKSGRTVGIVGMGSSAPTTFFASGAR